MTTPAAHVKDPAFRGRASLPYAVKRVELAVRSQLETLLKPSGITPVQYTALTVLERHDGVPAAQLARASFVTAQSIADVVRTLESRKLIYRQRNPANRRELLIHLTIAGRQLLARHAGEVSALEERMVRGLTDGQVEQFRHALNHVWHTLS
jgi:DNA-binding MarR family transcriptional regulator